MSTLRWYKGQFSLSQKLRSEHKAYLQRFAAIMHLPLLVERVQDFADPWREAVGLPIGPQGIYFTGLLDAFVGGEDLLNRAFEPSQETPIESEWKIEEKRLNALYDYTMEISLPPEYQMLTVTDARHAFHLSCWVSANAERKRAWVAPSAECEWAPTEEGRGIECQGGDKFLHPLEWLNLVQERFLQPWGYQLSGKVHYDEDTDASGDIVVDEQGIRYENVRYGDEEE